MPQTALLNLGLNHDWDAGDDAWKAGVDNNWALLDAFALGTVIDQRTAQPGAPAAGDAYITGAAATGAAWSGHNNELAVWNAATSAWVFAVPKDGWTVHDQLAGLRKRWDGSSWRPGVDGPVVFPASQVPSADPNTQDDYEEGEWTPILSDGTNDATNSIAVGRYVKKGKEVHIKCRILTSSLGSVSGAIHIKNLPFTSSAVANSMSSISMGFGQGLAINQRATVTGAVDVNNSIITLRLWDATVGTTNMLGTHWTTDGGIMLGGAYYV